MGAFTRFNLATKPVFSSLTYKERKARKAIEANLWLFFFCSTLRAFKIRRFSPHVFPMTARKLNCVAPVPSDIDIAQSVEALPITSIAESAGILSSELSPYGTTRAKVKLSILKRLEGSQNGKYVVVAGMNPTPLGEGKSTTTIGLAQALGAHLHRPCFACIRQPSQGPTFGIKGEIGRAHV